MQPISTAHRSHRTWLVCLAMAAAAIVVYGQVRHFEFVHFDDQDFVYNKPHITGGLSRENIVWALTTHDVGNYVPLTRLSWMLDVSLCGLRPGWFHVENVLLHLTNSLLIFFLLRMATGRFWPPAFVGLVCAVHPVRTESVAWISERKDVLSTLFALVTMIVYVRWTRETTSHRRTLFYVAMLACFILAMLAKQMLVTIPFVLILMDYWPLGRGRRGIRTLLAEKIPLLAITVAGGLTSYFAAIDVVRSTSDIPVLDRLENTFVSYARYLVEVFWPVNLSPFYPFQKTWPVWVLMASPLLLTVITAICLWARHRRPYLLMGWCWFLGVLVPSIGFVQVGEQSIADRWLYVPMIGLCIMVVWTAADVAERGGILVRRVIFVCGASVLIALGVLSHRQLGYWQNTRTLFTHALSIINTGPSSHMQIADLLLREGDKNTAIAEYQLAVKLAPYDFEPEYDLGNLLLDSPERAIPHYQRALVLRPHHAMVENNLAIAFARVHRPDLAFDLFRSAIADDPENAEPHANLGVLLESAGKVDAAGAEFEAALRIDPQNRIAVDGQNRLTHDRH